jgi:hypothetical protein
MDERREIQRTRILRDVRILIPGCAHPIESSIRNLTAKGAGLVIYTAILPFTFYLSFDAFRTMGLCRLIWQRNDKVGVVFDRT